jgi:hypothetical protein
MTTRAIRVTIRGSFDALTADQRATLLADAADHDMIYAKYTPEGHLSYDIAARPAFTFRFLTESADEAGIPDAAARAELAAEEWLTTRGYAVKGLQTVITDMTDAPLGARGRKTAR